MQTFSSADELRRYDIAFAEPERNDAAEFAGALGKHGDIVGAHVPDLGANAFESIAARHHVRQVMLR